LQVYSRVHGDAEDGREFFVLMGFSLGYKAGGTTVARLVHGYSVSKLLETGCGEATKAELSEYCEEIEWITPDLIEEGIQALERIRLIRRIDDRIIPLKPSYKLLRRLYEHKRTSEPGRGRIRKRLAPAWSLKHGEPKIRGGARRRRSLERAGGRQ
jgi:hypothetical protein